MHKFFENISELTTRKDYDIALAYVKKLIAEASSNGALADVEADNDYVREIGRIGRLCAAYEDNHIEYEHLTVRNRAPIILEYA